MGFPIIAWWIFPWLFVCSAEGKHPFTYGFPMVFLWFSHFPMGFPRVFLWFSHFPMGFPRIILRHVQQKHINFHSVVKLSDGASERLASLSFASAGVEVQSGEKSVLFHREKVILPSGELTFCNGKSPFSWSFGGISGWILWDREKLILNIYQGGAPSR